MATSFWNYLTATDPDPEQRADRTNDEKVLMFHIGTNNWQREGEFAPGSGILHKSFHDTFNSIDGVKCYSIYPSKVQSDPVDDPTFKIFKLTHDIPICESVSPNSSFRWHSMDDEQFAAYRKRLEDEVCKFMDEVEAAEGREFDYLISHHAFTNAMAGAQIVGRRRAEGKHIRHFNFVHGTALKMYIKEKEEDPEYPMRFLKLTQEHGVFDGSKLCDGVFVNSEDYIAKFLDCFPAYPKDHCTFSRIGVNQQVFQPSGATLDAVEKHLRETDKGKMSGVEQVVTFVGKFADWKRLDVVLQAASIYESTFPNLATLIVGSGPPEAVENYEKMAVTLGLKRTCFLGPKDQPVLAELFSVSEIGIFPSYKEPFGMVFIECMACGTPVIGAKSGGPVEFVTEEQGILIDEDEEWRTPQGLERLGKSLADAVNTALSSKLKETLGPKCVAFVKSNYSTRAQCDAMLANMKAWSQGASEHLNLSYSEEHRLNLSYGESAEAPKDETAAAEAPKDDAPAAEPSAEAPKADEPAAAASKAEEAPAAAEPTAEAPKADEPAAAASKAEEAPAAAEPAAEAAPPTETKSLLEKALAPVAANAPLEENKEPPLGSVVMPPDVPKEVLATSLRPPSLEPPTSVASNSPSKQDSTAPATPNSLSPQRAPAEQAPESSFGAGWRGPAGRSGAPAGQTSAYQQLSTDGYNPTSLLANTGYGITDTSQTSLLSATTGESKLVPDPTQLLRVGQSRAALREEFNLKEIDVEMIFQQFDQNHNEQLEVGELRQLLKTFIGRKSGNVTDEEMKFVMAVADKDHDDCISKKEVIYALQAWFAFNNMPPRVGACLKKHRISHEGSRMPSPELMAEILRDLNDFIEVDPQECDVVRRAALDVGATDDCVNLTHMRKAIAVWYIHIERADTRWMPLMMHSANRLAGNFSQTASSFFKKMPTSQAPISEPIGDEPVGDVEGQDYKAFEDSRPGMCEDLIFAPLLGWLFLLILPGLFMVHVAGYFPTPIDCEHDLANLIQWKGYLCMLMGFSGLLYNVVHEGDFQVLVQYAGFAAFVAFVLQELVGAGLVLGCSPAKCGEYLTNVNQLFFVWYLIWGPALCICCACCGCGAVFGLEFLSLRSYDTSLRRNNAPPNPPRTRE